MIRCSAPVQSRLVSEPPNAVLRMATRIGRESALLADQWQRRRRRFQNDAEGMDLALGYAAIL